MSKYLVLINLGAKSFNPKNPNHGWERIKIKRYLHPVFLLDLNKSVSIPEAADLVSTGLLEGGLKDPKNLTK